MLVVLKIPVFYVGWVVWWAIKAEPELGAEGGTEGVNWKPWRPPPPGDAARRAVRPRRADASCRASTSARREARREARMAERHAPKPWASS